MVDEKVDEMIDENVVDESVESVPKKKGFGGFLLWALIVIIVFAGFGIICYNWGYNYGVDAMNLVPNVSLNGSLFDDGFTSGVGYGLNMSIQRMLYYAQNCSVVRINYSDNIYGFIDATCVIPINKTVN